VVGSSIKTKFEMRDGKLVLARLQEVNFIDDKEGKPVGINSHIGRRSIAAFGKLRRRTPGAGVDPGLRRRMPDAARPSRRREWAYGPDSKIGTFNDSLMAEAEKSGWTVISMKDDWKTVYPGR
jgi:hypothetical protein